MMCGRKEDFAVVVYMMCGRKGRLWRKSTIWCCQGVLV